MINYILLFAILYHYFFFPIIIFIISIFFRQKHSKEEQKKFVSIIITVFNEEKNIQLFFENIKKTKYDNELLEIIIYDDNSSDDTVKIINDNKQYFNIELIEGKERKGKTYGQNQAVRFSKGDILIFTDAGVCFEENTIQEMVNSFSNEKIGCVAGEFNYKSEDNKNLEGFYVKYENKIKKMESNLGLLIGAFGPLYGVRKENYIELPDYYVSDLMQPLEIIKSGYDVILSASSKAYKILNRPQNQEYLRKRRIVTRSMNSIRNYFSFNLLIKKPLFSFLLFSHKILRWIIPILAMILFFTSLLSNRALFILQIMFYLIGAIGFLNEKYKLKLPFVNIIFYFILTNYGVLTAFIDLLFGKTYTFWQSGKK